MALRVLLVVGLLLGAMKSGSLVAQQTAPAPEAASHGDALVLPTLGGMQLWADELLFHRWRIQRHAVDGHYRLLDGNSLRYASGSFEHCLAALELIKRRNDLRPMQGKAVILLHGLGHTRASMVPLANYLEEQGGYVVLNVGYPSTRASIADHAASLARIMANLDQIDEVNFVAHSLGNIVIRRYLADQTDPAAGRWPDRRIRRFVMLGPPNQGSLAAHALADNPLFAAVFGPSGQELGRNWVWLESTLAVPRCEFGIIAGGLNNALGFSPLLPGDDDGVVTVESTRLQGAKDFLLVPVLHLLLIYDRRVQECTLRFLKTGRFREQNGEG